MLPGGSELIHRNEPRNPTKPMDERSAEIKQSLARQHLTRQGLAREGLAG